MIETRKGTYQKQGHLHLLLFCQVLTDGHWIRVGMLLNVRLDQLVAGRVIDLVFALEDFTLVGAEPVSDERQRCAVKDQRETILHKRHEEIVPAVCR